MSESIQIYLNNKYADRYYDNNKSNCEFILLLIEIPDGFHIYLSIANASIPYSFHNINSSNNILYYQLTGYASTYITIPTGNYSTTSLITALKSLMSNFTITYNNVKNLLTFTHSTYDFSFLSSSTCFNILGFSGSTLTSTNLSLTSDNCINVITDKAIQIQSNLPTYNINKVMLNNYSILCNIPINSPPYSIITYQNNNFRTNLFVNQISSLKIKLTDEYGNILNLNGCDFNITIQLDVEKFTA